MASIRSIPGMTTIWERSLGDPRVCIAILDGPVELSHPCFVGADLSRIESHWTDGKQLIPEAVEHATHITSVILGQHGSMVEGVAPLCRGINIPVIYDAASMLEPIALAHAVDLAFREGANIIHIASCIPTKSGAIDDLIRRAIRNCVDNNVLVVAPSGNDKGECFCVPAIVPGVIAVGACDDEGKPAPFTNFGGIYDQQGILAPEIDIFGAAPGGKTSTHKGTSCAAPIVTGIAALLMSIQLAEGWAVESHLVREAILRSACSYNSTDPGDQRRCSRGILNILGSMKQLFGLSRERQRLLVRKHGAAAQNRSRTQRASRRTRFLRGENVNDEQQLSLTNTQQNGISPSACECEQGKGLVFFIGLVSYDFGTEARRDTFKQQMPPIWYRRHVDGSEEFRFDEGLDQEARDDFYRDGFPRESSNPFDARQMVAYLKLRPAEARALIWTLNLESTPVYCIEPVGAFASLVYEKLVEMLDGQNRAAGEYPHIPGDPEYVERVSVPAVLTGRSVRLFSGQEVTEILVDAPRGMYAWRTNKLLERSGPAIEAAIEAAAPIRPPGVRPPNPYDIVQLIQ